MRHLGEKIKPIDRWDDVVKETAIKPWDIDDITIWLRALDQAEEKTICPMCNKKIEPFSAGPGGADKPLVCFKCYKEVCKDLVELK